MNTGAHTTPGDHRMHDDPDRRAAHAELRRRLDEGRAHANLNQTQLAARAALGRGTVSKALSPQGDVPSVDTVTKLARALKLPVGELLNLRRTAAEETDAVSPFQPGCGRDPERLSRCAVDGPAGDGIYGVLGESVSCRRGGGGSGVGAPVSGAARNASIT